MSRASIFFNLGTSSLAIAITLYAVRIAGSEGVKIGAIWVFLSVAIIFMVVGVIGGLKENNNRNAIINKLINEHPTKKDISNLTNAINELNKRLDSRSFRDGVGK